MITRMMGTRSGAWSWRPSDVATLGILALVSLVLALRVAAGIPLQAALLGHALLLVAFAAGCALLNRSVGTWAGAARGLLTVAVLFAVYVTLARVPFVAIPWTADAALTWMDGWLCGGRTPALAQQGRALALGVEGWSAVYGFFIPYLYLSIALGLLGREAAEREEFLTGFALTYAISYVGYLLAPARGPIVHLASDFTVPLPGGFFHARVVESIAQMGGPHGALPSLHVGASVYLCLFDLRRSRLRGLLYVPVVALIAVSAVMLRYHYVVDLIAGALIGGAAFALADRWKATSLPDQACAARAAS